jgi:hypothetical protein
MQQSLILGLGGFGAAVIERIRALPLEVNIVYHALECPRERPVAAAYLEYRKRVVDVLNREVYNFANTQLTVWLVGLLVEEHMADNLMHLGYLFKTLFRENVILNPRVKALTALPTLVPEEAYAWLGATRAALERIDGYAALKEQFQPGYPEVKRRLPAISGPPFEDVIFCYSESTDEEDLAVTAQAAATKVYLDLALLPRRLEAKPELGEFYRGFPAGQGFAPISGTAVAFLPSLTKLVADEMEYALMLRLVEAFFPLEPPDGAALDARAEDVLRALGALRPKEVIDGIVDHALQKERWFDLAALDAAGRYDAEMSPPPEAYLTRALASLDSERNRFAGRVRDLALEHYLQLPERLLGTIRESAPGLSLAEIDALLTRCFYRLSQHLEQARGLAQQARSEWERARAAAAEKAAGLKAIAGANDARLKHGSDAEARVQEALRAVDLRALLRLGLGLVVAEALAQDGGLEGRLREAYERLHERLASFLKRRNDLLAHLRDRRDAYLKRREMYLYVFNQVFRKRVLDAEIDGKLKELPPLPRKGEDDPLARVVASFFFKRWLAEPEMPLEDVEKALMEGVAAQARSRIERLAAGMDVDYSQVLQILREIADAQVSSIFDMKYKEHPQAAYLRAMLLYHRDPKLEPALAGGSVEGVDVADVAVVPDLPFQVLQVMEIYNLPFRALRQYTALEAAGT